MALTAEIPAILTASHITANLAISKLVKRIRDDVPNASGHTLYDSFLMKALDQHLGAEYKHAGSREEKRIFLLKRVKLLASVSKSTWLNDAICELTTSPSAIKRQRNPDRIKGEITNIMSRAPGISHKQICKALDRRGIALPERWQIGGSRTWTHAYLDKKIRCRLKPYLSKIKAHTNSPGLPCYRQPVPH